MGGGKNISKGDGSDACEKMRGSGDERKRQAVGGKEALGRGEAAAGEKERQGVGEGAWGFGAREDARSAAISKRATERMDAKERRKKRVSLGERKGERTD